MANTIEIKNVSKKYIIKHQKENSNTMLRDVVTQWTKKGFYKFLHPIQVQYEKGKKEDFWALKDINLNIGKGEKLGIIGRNGAGKSTLLKVLSRITEPTAGQIKIKGKVASLLEVGTGFHPELTGRENVFLNGAVLGMNRLEIRKRFDDIVSFAGIEKFLDTPVKRYSSGMYVRLAFAVAAHLEPEILIVDEVLAVGDFDFQKRCLGKMEEAGRQGKTVIFVSHRMPQIASLCSRVVLLDQGCIVKKGTPTEVIHYYYNKSNSHPSEINLIDSSRALGNQKAHLLRGCLLNEKNELISESKIDSSFIIEMEYKVLQDGLNLNPNFHIYNSEGTLSFVTADSMIDPKGENKRKKGIYKARCYIPGNYLNDGIYYIGLALSTMQTVEIHFYEKDCLQINIVDPIYGVATRTSFAGNIPGAVRPLLKWENKKIE